MQGPENEYGFIANTQGINANNEMTYQTTIETYINKLTASVVGVGVPDDPITDISNTNRTVLKITNTNQLEPIKGKAYYDETEEKIKIEVTYSTNKITKILNKNGKELPINSTTTDTGKEPIGNKNYEFIAIDNQGNLKEITVNVSGLDIYIIENEEDLKFFRDAVNSNKTKASTKAYQIADVKLNEGKYTIDSETGEIAFAEDAEKWTPIGITSTMFTGTYDGQGYTITGVYINASSGQQGLFGDCESGTIKNVNLKESQIISTGAATGGIAGRAATVENCSNSAEVKGSANVGGICGISDKLNINNCYNTGKISGSSYNVGGIIGDARQCNNPNMGNCYNTGEITGYYSVGGICGRNDIENIKIYNSYNIGKIISIGTANSTGKTGGIVGYSGNSIVLNNNYNLGEINGKNEGIGGIIGNGVNIKIENCFNNALIVGKEMVGGIVGRGNTIKLQKCYNKGNITGTGSYYCGGILGYTNDGTIETSYNMGDIVGNQYVGGICGQGCDLQKCYNLGNVNGKSYYVGGCAGEVGFRNNYNGQFLNNYNMGKVIGTGIVGGVIGYNYYKNISECYYETETADDGIGSSSDDTGCIVASRQEIIQQIEALDEYKIDEYNINNGYPILSWQTDNDNLNLINDENAFIEDLNGINGGFPILAWQVETTE